MVKLLEPFDPSLPREPLDQLMLVNFARRLLEAKPKDEDHYREIASLCPQPCLDGDLLRPGREADALAWLGTRDVKRGIREAWRRRERLPRDLFMLETIWPLLDVN